jgi:pimeloyl-ACP methyl ester carboxylesterase
VVLAHGSSSDRRALWHEGRALAAAGYGVLLFDVPGHGESGGVVKWGLPEQAALVAAVDLLAAQPEVDPGRLGVLGFSMGGHVAAQVAAKDPRLKAVVLVSTPADPEEHTRHEYRAGGALAAAAAVWAVRYSGMDLAFERPIDVVARIAPRRLFLIGGAADGLVTPETQRRLLAAAGEPKRLWLVDGAGHGDYAKVAPAEYDRQLRAFFDEGLL